MWQLDLIQFTKDWYFIVVTWRVVFRGTEVEGFGALVDVDGDERGGRPGDGGVAVGVVVIGAAVVQWRSAARARGRRLLHRDRATRHFLGCCFHHWHRLPLGQPANTKTSWWSQRDSSRHKNKKFTLKKHKLVSEAAVSQRRWRATRTRLLAARYFALHPKCQCIGTLLQRSHDHIILCSPQNLYSLNIYDFKLKQTD